MNTILYISPNSALLDHEMAALGLERAANLDAPHRGEATLAYTFSGDLVKLLMEARAAGVHIKKSEENHVG